MTEIERIKKIIEETPMEEFDNILYDCGIEFIKPSIESLYVKCLRKNLTENEYRKKVYEYTVNDEYFDMDVLEQEVA